MKFINKLFTGEQANWKDWLLTTSSPFDTPAHSSSGFLWRIVNDELNTYRSITFVRVHTTARQLLFGSITGF
jgi:hypothetical protein